MIKTRNGEKGLPAPGFESLPRGRGSNPGQDKTFFCLILALLGI